MELVGPWLSSVSSTLREPRLPALYLPRLLAKRMPYQRVYL
jgi:hypothetical protein